MKETDNRNFELILIEEDKLLNEMILKQQELRKTVENKDWQSLLSVISQINLISDSLVAKVATGVAIVVLLGGGTVGLAYASGLTGVKTAVGVALINTFVTDAKELFTDKKEPFTYFI